MRSTKKVLEREEALRLIYEGKWKILLDYLKNNHVFHNLMDDVVFADLFNQYFISELLSEQNDRKLELAAIFIFHTSRDYKFNLSDNEFRRLTLKLVELTGEERYAKFFPNEEKCKAILEKVARERQERIKVTEENYSLKQKFNLESHKSKYKKNYLISIFKSPQEEEFYKAAQKLYTEKIILPNVALSTVLSNEILNELEKKEKWYFLTTTIDLVIVDERTYLPIHFFELDSSFHDTEEQKAKDELKNELINKAGYTIHRIRRKDFNGDESDFLNLLNNIVDTNKNI